jgi:hypothetical protein
MRQNSQEKEKDISISLSNNLHKLHSPTPIHLSPHRKRQPDPPPQMLALPLHLAENGYIPPGGVPETRFDFKIETGAVLAHFGERLRDG